MFPLKKRIGGSVAHPEKGSFRGRKNPFGTQKQGKFVDITQLVTHRSV